MICFWQLWFLDFRFGTTKHWRRPLWNQWLQLVKFESLGGKFNIFGIRSEVKHQSVYWDAACWALRATIQVILFRSVSLESFLVSFFVFRMRQAGLCPTKGNKRVNLANVIIVFTHITTRKLSKCLETTKTDWNSWLFQLAKPKDVYCHKGGRKLFAFKKQESLTSIFDWLKLNWFDYENKQTIDKTVDN